MVWIRSKWHKDIHTCSKFPMHNSTAIYVCVSSFSCYERICCFVRIIFTSRYLLYLIMVLMSLSGYYVCLLRMQPFFNSLMGILSLRRKWEVFVHVWSTLRPWLATLSFSPILSIFTNLIPWTLENSRASRKGLG